MAISRRKATVTEQDHPWQQLIARFTDAQPEHTEQTQTVHRVALTLFCRWAEARSPVVFPETFTWEELDIFTRYRTNLPTAEGEPAAPASIRHTLQIVRTFLSWAFQAGLLPALNESGFAQAASPDPWSPERDAALPAAPSGVTREEAVAVWAEMIKDFIQAKAIQNTANTARFYRLQLMVWLGWLKNQERVATPREIKVADIRRFLLMRKTIPSERTGKLLAARTLRADVLSLKELMRWAHVNKYREDNLLREYELPHKEEVAIAMPSKEEIIRFLAAITDRWDPAKHPDICHVATNERRFHRRRDLAIFTGLIETGMRPKEMCSLILSDYQPEKKQVLIRSSKTHKKRYIPVTDAWIEIVNDWLKVRPPIDPLSPPAPEADWLFISIYGDFLTPNRLGGKFREYRDFAKLSGFTMYGFRHYTITQLVKTGDIAGAADFAGHSSWVTTKGYNHQDAEHTRKTHTDASPLGNVMRHKRSEEAITAKKSRKKLVPQ
jgi:site-specific recombinase XerD